MRAALVLVLAALLAGCSQPNGPAEAAAGGDVGLGVLRGIVVDEAITPLAGVAIVLSGAGTQRNTTSDVGGNWEFLGVPAGDYLVRANRSGFFEAQTQASVGADGGLEAPLTRLVLTVDQAQVPALEAFVFEGFLQCSATAIFVRQACNADELARPACDATGACGDNLTEDRFLAQHTFSRPGLSWVQSELQWDASSGLGENLRAVPGARDPDSGHLQDFAGVDGPAPLIVALEAEVANALGLGAGRDYVVRVFNSHMPGTAPPCLPSPIGCTFGVGLSTQQQFTLVTHAFYGFLPPEGWQFGRDGLPPVPPP